LCEFRRINGIDSSLCDAASGSICARVRTEHVQPRRTAAITVRSQCTITGTTLGRLPRAQHLQNHNRVSDRDDGHQKTVYAPIRASCRRPMCIQADDDKVSRGAESSSTTPRSNAWHQNARPPAWSGRALRARGRGVSNAHEPAWVLRSVLGPLGRV